ncbi:BAR adaptor protein Hob1 [Entomophthora muscae]|uniref:BAR adaptor protein Hob1 n=3 Tax=Entomophthora muscae TaxID=34485 RepID=A0ACC2T2G7_9FUNG|nr:BAR adaptor protein Hob1 [Entomophthora muscae]KAJ9081934.1 BAR adaptor protein Hob1 [Entomophthora muscae]
MSWRGFKKAVERIPANVKCAVGGNKAVKDETFDRLEAQFKILEAEVEKMLGHTKHFKESTQALVNHQLLLATALKEIYETNGEYDNATSSPEYHAAVQAYLELSQALKDDTWTELSLLDPRVLTPLGEIKGFMVAVRKLVTKRSHKILDLTRHTNTYNSLKKKENRDLSDEKKMYKYELLVQDAQDDYDSINSLLLEELPLLFEYQNKIILPIFQTFIYIQSKFYDTYTSSMDKLRHVAVFDYNSSVIDGFEARKHENAELVKHLEGLSTTLIRSSSVASARFRSKIRQNKDSSPDALQKSPESDHSSPKTDYAATSSSHQRSQSHPPPYDEPSSTKGTKILSTPTSPVKKPPPPTPPLLKARALYDYEPQAEGDLALKVDDVIDIIKKTNSTDDWWTGRLRGKIGVFPANYVVIL